jgi:TAT (twin-arginine translocation) pathway signal sequence/Protein of unknown function (DUF1501)
MKNFNRRHFLQAMGALGAGSALGMPQITFGQSLPGRPFWINVQAGGGWDQTLFCDPKPNLRPNLANMQVDLYGVNYVDLNGVARNNPRIGGAVGLEIKTTPNNGIPYLAIADFHASQTTAASYKPFFPNYYDRVTVFNGIDTGTNNHSVGERYCASGSSNETFPCIGAQLSAALGSQLPLGFMTMGGSDATADLISSTPMTIPTMRSLLMLTNPNDVEGDNRGTTQFYSSKSLDMVKRFRDERITRQVSQATLPDAKSGLTSLSGARDAQSILGNLTYGSGYYDDRAMTKIAFDAYRNGLAVSLNVSLGGFDSHGNAEAENLTGGVYGGTSGIYGIFEFLKFLIEESENPTDGKAPIPIVVVVTSDFGRSPYYVGAGTDHWPTASMMIVQNRPAKNLGLALPTNTVIGKTTDGNSSTALKPIKINPNTFATDSSGIIVTPGHVMRVVRRMAGIADHPSLKGFTLGVDRDLNLG